MLYNISLQLILYIIVCTSNPLLLYCPSSPQLVSQTATLHCCGLLVSQKGLSIKKKTRKTGLGLLQSVTFSIIFFKTVTRSLGPETLKCAPRARRNGLYPPQTCSTFGERESIKLKPLKNYDKQQRICPLNKASIIISSQNALRSPLSLLNSQ